MAFDSNQRPTVRVGGTHMIRIDLRNDLDENDEVTAGAVTELATSDLTITNAIPSTEETLIANDHVPARKAIEVTFSGHLLATGTYRLKVVFSTSGGVIDKAPKEDFVFDVVA